VHLPLGFADVQETAVLISLLNKFQRFKVVRPCRWGVHAAGDRPVFGLGGFGGITQAALPFLEKWPPCCASPSGPGAPEIIRWRTGKFPHT